MTAAEATVVLAHAPDGARHVFLTSTRRSGTRSLHHGIADPSSDAPTGSLARLVAPTRLESDADLADLLAHLVSVPAPSEESTERRAVDVLALTSGPPLPESLPGTLGRDFELRERDAAAVLGTGPDRGAHALLFASPSAPGGAWWRAVGEVPTEVLAFGHLVARAGLFGGASNGADSNSADSIGAGGAPSDGDAPPAIAACDPRAIEARLRGLDLAVNATDVDDIDLDVEIADRGARWTLGRGDEARSWTTPAWNVKDVARIDAARTNALAPYWLLVFETRAGVLRLSSVANARRSFVARIDRSVGDEREPASEGTLPEDLES